MRITESQLRRIIREEVGRLVEMPARRTMVHTDPDEMPPGPKVSRAQKIARGRRSFAHQQLELHEPAKLNLLKTAPEAYNNFLVSLYDMTEDGSTEGLDGRGFVPHLDAALEAAGLSGMDDFDPEVFAAEVNQRMPVAVAARGGKAKEKLADQIISDLYRSVVKPYDDYIRENDVQGTSRMMVGDIASPGEKRLLQVISLLHRHQQYPLTVAMSKRSYARSSVKKLEDLSNYLAGAGNDY